MDRKLYIASDYFHFVADQSEMGLFISELRIQQVFFYFHFQVQLFHPLSFQGIRNAFSPTVLAAYKLPFLGKRPPGKPFGHKKLPFFLRHTACCDSLLHNTPLQQYKRGEGKMDNGDNHAYPAQSHFSSFF